MVNVFIRGMSCNHLRLGSTASTAGAPVSIFSARRDFSNARITFLIVEYFTYTGFLCIVCIGLKFQKDRKTEKTEKAEDIKAE